MAQGTRVAGRYRLHTTVSRGGLGTLWAATDERSGLPVSVRRLTRGLDDRERVARFRASAVAAARLAHPNIARVLDEGEDDDGPFIVSEWIDGRPLSAWRGTADWGFLRPIFAQTCDALGYLHARGLVHLDLRPQQLVVVAGDDGPEVRLTDVGCARIDDGWGDRSSGARLTLKYLGSVRYLAPEVGDSPPWAMGPWSDMYSLGLVIWELLVGSLPDGELDGVALLLQRAANPAPLLPVGVAGPHDREMGNLLARLLTREPSSRPDAARARRTIEAMVAPVHWLDPPPREWIEQPPFEVAAAPAAGFPLLPLRDGPLIGRREQLHQGWQALQATVSSGHSHAVFLRGPVCGGKSHLARMIVEHAAMRGTAASVQLRYHDHAPGRTVARALEELLRAGDTDAQGIAARAQRLDLLMDVEPHGFDRVLPALLRPDPTPFARPGHEPEPDLDVHAGDASEFVASAFAELCRRAARDRTLVVWLDDLHRATELEGAQLIEALLNVPDTSFFVVATVRDDARGEALRARFADPGRHSWIDMPRLTSEAIRTYVRLRLSPTPETENVFVEALRRAPERLRSLTDFALAGRLMRTDEGNALMPGTLLPETDHELFESLLATLPAARADALVPDVVAGLALARVPIGPAVVEALYEVDPNRPFGRALAAAERARMMVRGPTGGWEFASDGLQRWLESYGAPRAQSWHRRWLAALKHLEGDGRGRFGLERAAHAHALDEADTALDALLEACAWALGPGQQALNRGLEAAEQARRLACETGDSRKRAQANRLRAEILRHAGRYAEARQAVADAEDALGAGDTVERGWCALARGWLSLSAASAAERAQARGRFEKAEATFDGVGDLGGKLWARLGLARLDSLEGRHGAARAGARGIELAFTRLGAKRGTLAARMLRASAADRAADYELAEERYAVLQRLADRKRWLIESTQLRLRRVRLLLELERATDALELLDEARQTAVIAGLDDVQRWIRSVRPATLAAAGRTGAAEEALARATMPALGARASAAAAQRAALRLPSAQLDAVLFGRLQAFADQTRSG